MISEIYVAIIEEYFLILRIVKHCNRLHTHLVKSPSLEADK